MSELRTRQVFVPGGQPQYTYVDRNNHRLEADLNAAKDNICKLVTVTGPTKSGKSVLTKRVFPESDAVWVDGGSVAQEDDLWSAVLARIGGSSTTSDVSETVKTVGGGLEASSEVGVKVIAKVAGKLSGSYSRAKRESSSKTTTATLRAAALTQLRQSNLPLVIDDFHYLPVDLQGAVVRGLKALVFNGHPTILLAIPHRRYDADRVEREMTGRVRHIVMPEWTRDELRKIPLVGLPLLNATVDEFIVELMLAEALGSPHLVQEFFQEMCVRDNLVERAAAPREVAPRPSATALLQSIARDMSRPVFDALVKGPHQRSVRIQRQFRDGRAGDMYLAVLNAIAALKPGIVAIDYEQIRASLKELLIELPAAHEVSRVLEHMSRIQATEGASAPVLDWDKKSRRLHITDPYFAFYLKWGADVFLIDASAPTGSQTGPLLPGVADGAGPRGGRKMGSAKQSTLAGLSSHESAIVRHLAKFRRAQHIAQIASACFSSLPAAQANSWTRNSLRRPVKMGIVERVGGGMYRKVP